jgi:polar amino acid transport system permease protein
VNYDWNFARLEPYWRAFLTGTVETLKLTAIVIVLGTAIGALLGAALRIRSIRLLLYPLIDVVRAVPPLVLILFMYYVLTAQVIGTTIARQWVYCIAMAMNLAAFTSDIVRAAIENVPPESADAARALGMTEAQLARYITIPHVIRETIPSMTVLYIGMLKMSSLASVINVREVVYAAQTVIADISRSLESWTVVAIIYIVLVVPATYGARALEKWSGRGKRTLEEQ